MTLLINNPSMRIYNILWHITQHSFSRGLSSSQMKRKLCKHFSKMSLFTAQYFNFHLNSKLVELFVGGHSAKPQLRTFASVHQPWTPLTISRHIFTDWRNGQTRDGKNWQGAEYERMRRCGVDGHGLERKRSRNEMDHWWHTSLSARPHNHYTNTQSPHKQTQTQRNKDKHGHINILASKVFSD